MRWGGVFNFVILSAERRRRSGGCVLWSFTLQIPLNISSSGAASRENVIFLQHSNTQTLRNTPTTTFFIKPSPVVCCFKQSEILVEHSKALLTSELILLENLTKDFIPFFPNQFPAKFDIIGVRWEGRGAGCRLETFHYHASQIKTDSFDKSVKTRWFCTGGERVGQSGAKYGRDQRY